MQKSKLVVFARNPALGKVKSRIAKLLGNEKALKIYHKLLDHTIYLTENSGLPFVIYFSDHISYTNPTLCRIQQGKDLGEKMLRCFIDELATRQKVCLIGSDCLLLTQAILQDAFTQLATHDVVVGPAADGGYYLIGMKKPHHELFKDIAWGTDAVLAGTLDKCQKQNLSVKELPILNDIDRPEDVPLEWL